METDADTALGVVVGSASPSQKTIDGECEDGAMIGGLVLGKERVRTYVLKCLMQFFAFGEMGWG